MMTHGGETSSGGTRVYLPADNAGLDSEGDCRHQSSSALLTSFGRGQMSTCACDVFRIALTSAAPMGKSTLRCQWQHTRRR